ncbi:translation elongation factor Ts [Microaceticoccus formicicus]|uniref:translation elongation factor Ts n=1 Tax=Microaceticoccus formicicus TaxID=3118105 RepID=UPI003CD00076|nr:translation elongation factor Ts [Peptoniphilaceae bacterium AMB_02]
MAYTAADVKELRAKTGAGMMDCKNALVETDGDIDKAVALLREKGLAGAEKKAGRIASEGIVDSYIHGGRIGVLIEVNTETDFVAKNEDFKRFVKDMAMQVAASNPKYVSREEIPESVVANERQVLVNQAMNESAEKNIPEDKAKMIAEKKVEGRMEKFFEDVCILDQPFIKDPSRKVGEILTELISVIGENIKIRRFMRYEVGEGLEKREENFAEEVAKQIG